MAGLSKLALRKIKQGFSPFLDQSRNKMLFDAVSLDLVPSQQIWCVHKSSFDIVEAVFCRYTFTSVLVNFNGKFVYLKYANYQITNSFEAAKSFQTKLIVNRLIELETEVVSLYSKLNK